MLPTRRRFRFTNAAALIEMFREWAEVGPGFRPAGIGGTPPVQ